MIDVLLAVFLVALPEAAGTASAHAIEAIGVFLTGAVLALVALAVRNAWDTFWSSV